MRNGHGIKISLPHESRVQTDGTSIIVVCVCVCKLAYRSLIVLRDSTSSLIFSSKRKNAPRLQRGPTEMEHVKYSLSKYYIHKYITKGKTNLHQHRMHFITWQKQQLKRGGRKNLIYRADWPRWQEVVWVAKKRREEIYWCNHSEEIQPQVVVANTIVSSSWKYRSHRH